MSVEHNFYLWYNPQDRYYYLNCQNFFDGFCISSHLAAHYGNAFSAILNETSKSYFIDPETVAFQTFDLTSFYNENGNLRMSWEKILDQYPSQIKEIIKSRRSLTISDFINKRGEFAPLLYDLILQVISFQQRIIENRISGLSDFMDVTPELQFIVAPYFYFNSIQDDWYKINIKILNEFNDLKINNHKYVIICFNKDILLQERDIEILSSDFLKSNIDGYLLWINSFDETNEQMIYFDNLIKLIHNFSHNNKKIINLYGSYFSILSSYWGMSGHVSGVNSRDLREVNEMLIGGGPPGGPIPRYYIPPLHTRVVIDQGVRMIRQFNEFQCDCPVCQTNRHGYNPSIDRSEGRRIMNRHFLYIRNKEINDVKTHSYADTFSQIDQIYRQYEMSRAILPISHLRNWWGAITRNINLL